MNEQKYYPAAFIGDSPNPREALRSLGVFDDEAELCLAGIVVDRTRPVVFEAQLEDPSDGLPGLRLSKTALAMMMRKDGSVRVWVALLGHLNASRKGALLDALDDLRSSSSGLDKRSRIDVFELPENVVVDSGN